MKSFLQRIKLIDHLTTEIPLERRVLVEKLQRNVDPGGTGFLFSGFDVLRSGNAEYKGTVTFDSFKIRRKRRLFDTSMSLAVAEGTIREHSNGVMIEATISGARGLFIPFFIVVSIFYIIFITAFFLGENTADMAPIMIPFIILHALFMLGIPYYMTRRGVARMKYELERDLFYLTK